MATPAARSPWLRIAHGAFVAIGASGLAALCFLVLPVLQAISSTPPADLSVTSIDTALLQPPPPPQVEEEPEEEKPEEPKPPELTDELPPMDLAQLELALSPGLGAFEGAGDFTLRIQGIGAGGPKSDDVEELFSLADLDQKPRALFQQQPNLTAALRKRLPATVYVLFTVDPSGRIENPVIQSSTDPAFEPVVLAAIKQWKFEPGKRSGQPVRFRMRQPFSFQ
jgi:periplasmic protein TonB